MRRGERSRSAWREARLLGARVRSWLHALLVSTRSFVHSRSFPFSRVRQQREQPYLSSRRGCFRFHLFFTLVPRKKRKEKETSTPIRNVRLTLLVTMKRIVLYSPVRCETARSRIAILALWRFLHFTKQMRNVRSMERVGIEGHVREEFCPSQRRDNNERDVGGKVIEEKEYSSEKMAYPG